ncbi:MAG: nucleoside deaminase [Desulfobacterales bacterium]|nr:nucleoside deaminase [Desulfobacterales bacterium]
MDPQPGSSHQDYMRVCLDLARKGRAAGYLGIGALIVRKESIISEAHELLPHAWDVTGHAELLAVRRACERLNSHRLSCCTLLTTAEPCWMCAFAIRETGIEMVVIGAPTDDIGGLRSKYPILSDADVAGWGPPPRVITGVMAEDCAALRTIDPAKS